MFSYKEEAKQYEIPPTKHAIYEFWVDSLNAEGRLIHFVDIFNKTRRMIVET